MEGKLVWRFDLTEIINAWFFGLSTYENLIIFGCYDKNVYALDTEGNVKWKYKGTETMYVPRIWKDRAYVGSRDNCIHCLNAKDGKLIWKFKSNGFLVDVSLSDGKV